VSLSRIKSLKEKSTGLKMAAPTLPWSHTKLLGNDCPVLPCFWAVSLRKHPCPVFCLRIISRLQLRYHFPQEDFSLPPKSGLGSLLPWAAKVSITNPVWCFHTQWTCLLLSLYQLWLLLLLSTCSMPATDPHALHLFTHLSHTISRWCMQKIQCH
jgi:hypothetical protein